MPNLEQAQGVGKSKLTGAGVGAGLAQAAKALHEHWRGEQGILAVDQVVEELVVSRRSHIEELFNGALFGTRVAPPLAFEIQDSHF